MNAVDASIRTHFEKALVGSTPSVNQLIRYCAHIAEAYLRMKMRSHKQLMDFIGDDLSSFALDCIADLFERRQDRFIKLEKWKERLNSAEEPFFLIELRKLVFTQTNDHVFATYRRMSPALSKILRNIKRAIEQDPSVKVLYDRKKGYIYLREATSNFEPVELELFQMRLSTYASKAASIPEILRVLPQILEDFGPNAAVPINYLAMSLLQLEVIFHDSEVVGDSDVLSEVYDDEIKLFLATSLKKIDAVFSVKYVERQKLKAEEYACCLQAVRDILTNEYALYVDTSMSYYQRLRAYMVSLDQKTYQKRYRSILEYMVKKTRELLLLTYVSELKSAEVVVCKE